MHAFVSESGSLTVNVATLHAGRQHDIAFALTGLAATWLSRK